MSTKTLLLSLVVASCCLFINLSCSKSNGGSPAPKSDVNLKSGLLVYVDFNGSLADSSGNGNPVTMLGSGSLGYDEHGNANSAFDNNGTSTTRVIVTNNGSIKFDTALTISCDVMVKSQGIYSFLAYDDNMTGHGASFDLGTNLLANSNINFGVVDSLGGCDGFPPIETISDLNPSFAPEPYSWYNLIATYHNGQMAIYANGKLVGSQTNNMTRLNFCPNDQLEIGNYWGGNPTPAPANAINGRIDEVRLYNRVLNADEIAELSKDFQQY